MECDFNDMIIELVRKFPHIYDTKNPSYKDNAKRDKCWMNISKETGQDIKACATRWKSLRDRYQKERKKSELSSESVDGFPNCNHTWKYYKQLTFLDNHIKPRISSNKFKREIPENLESSGENVLYANASKTRRCRTERNDISPSSPQKKTAVEEEVLTLMKEKNGTNGEVTSPARQQTEDSAEYFGKYVACRLGNMPPYKSNKAAVQIIQYLNDIEYE